MTSSRPAAIGPGKPPAHHGAHRGFSLLELLVVIGVVAVQAAILLPAVARVRTTSRGVGCLGNLRLWALATHAYAADHEDLLPPEGAPNPSNRDDQRGWYIQLPRQLSLPAYHESEWRTNPAAVAAPNAFLCPSNARRSNGRNLFHYCLNQHVDGAGAEDSPVRIASIPQPAQLVWLFDSKNLPAVGYWNFVHTNLHSAGAQFLFLDGHARRFPAAVYWDPVTRRARSHPEGFSWFP